VSFDVNKLVNDAVVGVVVVATVPLVVVEGSAVVVDEDVAIDEVVLWIVLASVDTTGVLV
jgi:hypothetical protein